MDKAQQLPGYLVNRYLGWKATSFAENRSWYRHLADVGQHPRAMVISCCDSRVHVTSIFGADQGEFFIHRNIAALVPPHNPGGNYHGTSAAIEYAVKALRVAHVLVVGHSGCGGVKGCIDLCAHKDGNFAEEFMYVAKWLDILKPGFKDVKGVKEPERLQREMEQKAVLVSLENLMTFPFVAGAVASGELSLHGLWHDISEGQLCVFDPRKQSFLPL